MYFPFYINRLVTSWAIIVLIIGSAPDCQLIASPFIFPSVFPTPSDTSLANDYLRDGDALRSVRKYDKAITYYLKASNIFESLAEWQGYVTSLNYVGYVYRLKDDFDNSIIYIQKALGVGKDKLGDKHNEIASTYNNLGITYQEKKEYETALFYFHDALSIWLKKVGENHLNIAKIYKLIARAHSAEGNNEKALEFYTKSLQIMQDVAPDHKPDIARTYHAIGITYYNKGEMEQACAYIDSGLTMKMKMAGSV